MRVIAEFDPDQATPLLRFFIHGAPHRRSHQAVLKQYRRALWDAGREAQIAAPLVNNVELSATVTSPTSPDLDNLTDGAVSGTRRQSAARARRLSPTTGRSCSSRIWPSCFHSSTG